MPNRGRTYARSMPAQGASPKEGVIPATSRKGWPGGPKDVELDGLRKTLGGV